MKGLRVEDRGLSLVELAVYIVVFGIITAVFAATLIVLFRSEATVSGLTTSASDAQTAATILRGDIRNAREIRVSDDRVTVTASVAGRSASGSGSSTSVDWKCVRWQVIATDNGLDLTRAERDDLHATDWGTSGTLLRDVSNRSDEGTTIPFFSGGALLGETGTVTYSWLVATSDSGTLEFVGETRNRPQGEVSVPAPTCFT